MNKITSICLATLLLTGCMSTAAPPRPAGLYAFLDPTSGRTYYLPVPALRTSAPSTLAKSSPGVGPRIGAVGQLDVPERSTPVARSTAALPATRSETVQMALVEQDVVPLLKLKLDTEFASFALSRVTLGTNKKTNPDRTRLKSHS